MKRDLIKIKIKHIRRNRKRSAEACCRHFLPSSSLSPVLFSANSFLLRLPPFVNHLSCSHSWPRNKTTLIIKHNYRLSLTRDQDGDNRKEKTKYDNCVREKSNCAKQSYTHLINLAALAGPIREISHFLLSLFSLSANVLQKVI